MFDLGSVEFSPEWIVVIAIALLAGLMDLFRRRVPNLLTGPAWILGLAWALGNGGVGRLAEVLAASVILATPYVLLFVFAGGGAGDAKLMAAIGAWLGMLNGLLALFAIALCGALLAVAYALHHGRFSSVMRYMKQSISTVMYVACNRGKMSEARCVVLEREEMITMPYGVAIFLGSCMAAGGAQLWSI